MSLTTGQLREVLGLSQDAYRHWKVALPPLAERQGRRARYSHGDLLALAIIKSLTEKFSVPVGSLVPVSGDIFDACGRQSWARLERSTALIFPEKWELQIAPENQPLPIGRPMFSVPCGPIIADLRSALMIDLIDDPQSSLRFPLAAVVADRGRASK